MPVNVVDRVPTYPGRVKMTPVSGQADVYDMERADAPSVQGTPINKALFDKIPFIEATENARGMFSAYKYIGQFTDIVVGDGILVAHSFMVAGSLSYSTDGGVSWTPCILDDDIIATYPGQVSFNDTDGRFYMVIHVSTGAETHNNNDALCYSDDGIHWHLHQSFMTYKAGLTSGRYLGCGVLAVGNNIVVSGAYNHGYYSMDNGVTWNNIPWSSYASSHQYKDSYVCYANGIWGVVTSAYSGGDITTQRLHIATNINNWTNTNLSMSKSVCINASSVGDAIAISAEQNGSSSSAWVAFKPAGSTSFVSRSITGYASIGCAFTLNDEWFYITFNNGTVYKTQDFITMTEAFTAPGKISNYVPDGDIAYIVVLDGFLLITGDDIVDMTYAAKTNNGEPIGAYTAVFTGSYSGSISQIILPVPLKPKCIIFKVGASSAYLQIYAEGIQGVLFLPGIAIFPSTGTSGYTSTYAVFC